MRLILALFVAGWFGAHGEALMDFNWELEGSGETSQEYVARGSKIATVTTATWCAVVGALLLGLRRQWGLSVLWLPLIGGMLNISSALLLMGEPEGLALDPFGIAYGLLYVPVVGALEWAHFAARTPRTVWRVMGFILLTSSVFDRLPGMLSSPWAGPTAAAVAVAAIGVVLLLLDGAERSRRRAPPASLSGGPYREAPVPLSDDGRALLHRAVKLDGLMLASAVMLLLFSALRNS